MTRYANFIREGADPVGWPIERVPAHIMIESQGFPNGSEFPPARSYEERFNGLIAEQSGASEQTDAAGDPEIATA